MKQDGDGIMWGYDELFCLGVFSTGAQQDVTTGWPLHTCIGQNHPAHHLTRPCLLLPFLCQNLEETLSLSLTLFLELK